MFTRQPKPSWSTFFCIPSVSFSKFIHLINRMLTNEKINNTTENKKNNCDAAHQFYHLIFLSSNSAIAKNYICTNSTMQNLCQKICKCFCFAFVLRSTNWKSRTQINKRESERERERYTCFDCWTIVESYCKLPTIVNEEVMDVMTGSMSSIFVKMIEHTTNAVVL